MGAVAYGYGTASKQGRVQEGLVLTYMAEERRLRPEWDSSVVSTCPQTSGLVLTPNIGGGGDDKINQTTVKRVSSCTFCEWHKT